MLINSLRDFLEHAAAGLLVKMTHVVLNEELARTLRDKVVVLTGGSTGIGRAAVELFVGEYQVCTREARMG